MPNTANTSHDFMPAVLYNLAFLTSPSSHGNGNGSECVMEMGIRAWEWELRE